MSAVLLDTCAIVFVANDEPIGRAARAAIVRAATGDGVLVSPVSAWEIGILAAGRRLTFAPDARSWFQAFAAREGVRLAALTAEAAIDSSFLPATLHGDPADRLLVATARELGVPIVTRDRAIIAYAQAGHVKAVAC
jgi:PIN domain nuclease of toxin-antitoxin system